MSCSVFDDFAFMSPMVSKRCQFSTDLNFGNKKIARCQVWEVERLGEIVTWFTDELTREGEENTFLVLTGDCLTLRQMYNSIDIGKKRVSVTLTLHRDCRAFLGVDPLWSQRESISHIHAHFTLRESSKIRKQLLFGSWQCCQPYVIAG